MSIKQKYGTFKKLVPLLSRADSNLQHRPMSYPLYHKDIFSEYANFYRITNFDLNFLRNGNCTSLMLGKIKGFDLKEYFGDIFGHILRYF